MNSEARCAVCGRLFVAGELVHDVKCWRFNHASGSCWWQWCEACRIDSEHRPSAISPSIRDIKQRVQRLGMDMDIDAEMLRRGLFRDVHQLGD